MPLVRFQMLCYAFGVTVFSLLLNGIGSNTNCWMIMSYYRYQSFKTVVRLVLLMLPVTSSALL